MRTRAELHRAAKKAGFAGDATLEAFKAWSDDPTDPKSFDLGEGVTVDQVWANNPARLIALDAPAVKAKPIANGATEVHADTEERSYAPSPGGLANMAARKAYDLKAKSSQNKKGQPHFPDADTAVHFKAWARSTVAGQSSYAGRAEDEAIIGKAGITTTLTLGGALVPADFQPFLISLKEERGALRKLLSPVPMSRDVVLYPRRTSGLTVYAPGEATAITASDAGFDQVQLTAFKMGTLSTVSNELFNDAAVSVGDIIAEEIAYAFADKEDECYFNGDGTSTYFHQTGCRAKLYGLSGTAGNIAGLVSNAGINLYSEFTAAHFEDVVGRLPQYASPNAKWVVSRPFYFNVMRRLELAQGGSTALEMTEYGALNFLGYPVVFAQVMPRVDADSTVHCLFGDFAAGSKFGEVSNSMAIATSDQYSFNLDAVSIRGVQRVAINVHDVGNASATASLRIPGPICGLASTT